MVAKKQDTVTQSVNTSSDQKNTLTVADAQKAQAIFDARKDVDTLQTSATTKKKLEDLNEELTPYLSKFFLQNESLTKKVVEAMSGNKKVEGKSDKEKVDYFLRIIDKIWYSALSTYIDRQNDSDPGRISPETLQKMAEGTSVGFISWYVSQPDDVKDDISDVLERSVGSDQEKNVAVRLKGTMNVLMTLGGSVKGFVDKNIKLAQFINQQGSTALLNDQKKYASFLNAFLSQNFSDDAQMHLYIKQHLYQSSGSIADIDISSLVTDLDKNVSPDMLKKLGGLGGYVSLLGGMRSKVKNIVMRTPLLDGFIGMLLQISEGKIENGPLAVLAKNEVGKEVLSMLSGTLGFVPPLFDGIFKFLGFTTSGDAKYKGITGFLNARQGFYLLNEQSAQFFAEGMYSRIQKLGVSDTILSKGVTGSFDYRFVQALEKSGIYTQQKNIDDVVVSALSSTGGFGKAISTLKDENYLTNGKVDLAKISALFSLFVIDYPAHKDSQSFAQFVQSRVPSPTEPITPPTPITPTDDTDTRVDTSRNDGGGYSINFKNNGRVSRSGHPFSGAVWREDSEYSGAPGHCVRLIGIVADIQRHGVEAGNPTFTAHASNWYPQPEALKRYFSPKTKSQKPALGDVVVFGPSYPGSNGYGHIGFVLQDTGSNLVVASMNVAGLGSYKIDTLSKSSGAYKSVKGFLSPTGDRKEIILDNLQKFGFISPTSSPKEQKEVSSPSADGYKGEVTFEELLQTEDGKKFARYKNDILRHCASQGVPPAVLLHLMILEGSHGDPTKLTGTDGGSAYGLTQITNATWQDYGKGLNRHDASDQILAGARYLKHLYKAYRQDRGDAIIRYHTGPGIDNLSSSTIKKMLSGNPAVRDNFKGDYTAENYYKAAAKYYQIDKIS